MEKKKKNFTYIIIHFFTEKTSGWHIFIFIKCLKIIMTCKISPQEIRNHVIRPVTAAYIDFFLFHHSLIIFPPNLTGSLHSFSFFCWKEQRCKFFSWISEKFKLRAKLKIDNEPKKKCHLKRNLKRARLIDFSFL